MQFQSITIRPEDEGKRLDIFLADKLGKSRNYIQNLISAGQIRINKAEHKKNAYKLGKNDEIAYKLVEIESKVEAEDIKLDIIFENDDYFVINKNAGVVVHPSDTGHTSGTILNAALNISKSAALVHRLDKDTSGVLVIAKNQKSKNRLSKLFKDRKVEKTYLALVRGIPRTPTGRIEAAIKRQERDRKRMSINSSGKEAVSYFKVLEVYSNAALLEVKIETGRTHQIRVHMASIGHPIIGDSIYGDRKINEYYKEHYGLERQFLHAAQIKIDGQTFKAKLSKDLNKVYKTLTRS